MPDVTLRAISLEPDASFGARRSVDSLRFGLVPEDRLLLITVRSQEIQDWAKARFPDPSQKQQIASAVVRRYGTGREPHDGRGAQAGVPGRLRYCRSPG